MKLDMAPLLFSRKEDFVKTLKYITGFFLCTLLFSIVNISVCAAPYTREQSISGKFSEHRDYVNWDNEVYPFELDSAVMHVVSISGYCKTNNLWFSEPSFPVDIYYKDDGGDFYYAGQTQSNLVEGMPCEFNLYFDEAVEKIISLAFVSPMASYLDVEWEISSLLFISFGDDDTEPQVEIYEPNEYSNSSIIVYFDITDEESGVAKKKWMHGVTDFDYVRKYGDDFDDHIVVTESSLYCIYISDNAGNETKILTNFSMIDKDSPHISATASSEYAQVNTITVEVSDRQSGVEIVKWAYGRFDKTFFSTAGTILTEPTITVDQNGEYTIYSRDRAGNEAVVYVTVDRIGAMITVTHPVFTSFIINPNEKLPFISEDIELTNNSSSMVQVSLQEIANIERDICLVNVEPDYFSNWDILTALQSKKYIALGVKAKDSESSISGWHSIMEGTFYGANLPFPASLGVLSADGGRGSLKLKAKHGLAFSEVISVSYKIILIFEAV